VTPGAFAALAGLLLLGGLAFIMRSRKAALRGGAPA
jgi:LPXTG-motif cell wall-anchored protein